jgi:hypothetical protein
MKVVKLTCFLILSLLAIQFHLLAQPASREILEQVAAKLVNSLEGDKREEIYVHSDKPYYHAGSIIWFKVYLREALSGKIADNRNNIYLDLVDSRDSVVQHLILNSSTREWDGGMEIPARVREGYYELRAYTREMAVIPDNWFKSVIFVINDRNKSATTSGTGNSPSAATGFKPELTFYPEGGSLVSGIDNTVAIVARKGQSGPLQVRGSIYDDNNRLVSSFQTGTDGYGLAQFVPVRKRKYTAVAGLPDGKEVRLELPDINDQACQLNLVKQDARSVRFRIVLGDSLYVRKPASYLLGVSGGKVCFAGMGNGMYEVDVPDDKFRPGPATFYLYDYQQKLVSERRVDFRKKGPSVQFKTERDNYASRQKVNAELTVLDSVGKPLPALLSVSVTDSRMVQWDSTVPGSSPEIARTEPALIALSSRPSLAERLQPAAADSGIVITGTVFNKEGSPFDGQVITLLAGGSDIMLSDTTDASGRFSFQPFYFTSEMPFLAQVSDIKGVKQVATVKVDGYVPVIPVHTGKHVVAAVAPPQDAFMRFRKADADSFLRGSTREWLDEIVVKGGKQQGKPSASNKRTDGSRRITAEQLSKLGLSTTANAVLMLPGVILVGGKLTIRGGMHTITSGAVAEPLLLVDGVPAATSDVINALNSINPQLIDYIEVLTAGEAAYYGSRGANGVILVKTSNQLSPVSIGDPNRLIYIFPTGYHVRPVFYQPPYDTYGVREASFMDNRSTIYWNGEVVLQKGSPAKIEFYTADLPSVYLVRIIGVTAAGDWISQVFQVNRN